MLYPLSYERQCRNSLRHLRPRRRRADRLQEQPGRKRAPAWSCTPTNSWTFVPVGLPDPGQAPGSLPASGGWRTRRGHSPHRSARGCRRSRPWRPTATHRRPRRPARRSWSARPRRGRRSPQAGQLIACESCAALRGPVMRSVRVHWQPAAIARREPHDQRQPAHRRVQPGPVWLFIRPSWA